MGVLQLLGAPNPNDYGPSQDDLTDVEYYDPSSGKTDTTSKTAFNYIQRSIEAQDKVIQEYVNGSPEFKKKFDEEHPEYWDNTGKPGSPGYRSAQKLVVISETIREKSKRPKPKPKPKGKPPTKINTTTGKGVPGGFDASSVKLPDVQAKKQVSTISSIASKVASIGATILAIKSGKIPSIPGIMGAAKILTNLTSATVAKLKIAKKAPNFSKTVSIPQPPKTPTVPNFKSLGIPELPKSPSTPSVPGVSGVTGIPSTPSVPGVSGVTKFVPKLIK